MTASPELTIFTKSDGPLTKTIMLVDGKTISDASDCRMSSGNARRRKVNGVTELAELIEAVKSNQALALGAMRPGLPDHVDIVTKAKLLNGVAPHTIARVAGDINYRPKQPAFALLDFDTKGMPPEIAAEIEKRGGFWAALVSLFPVLGGIARVSRSSTSAGLFRSDTGAKLPGSGGLHCFLEVQDGADVERFLKTLHDRCWLAGFGWMMVGAGGQLLERSLIDRSVFGAERLVFEGPPTLMPPLSQDLDSRRPIVALGDPLDTYKAFRSLSIVEKTKLDELITKASFILAPEARNVRQDFKKAQADRIIARTGASAHAAEHAANCYCNGELLPAVELLFDDPQFAGMTVGDVLADPDRFEGATLADPLEGIAYGTCKAKVMRNPDGTPWIHSFAHGRTVYQLKYDANAVKAAMQKAADHEVVKVFVGLAAAAKLDEEDIELLIEEAVKRSKVNKTTIKKMLTKEQKRIEIEQAKADRLRRKATRTDPRPQFECPDHDAEWLPVMEILNGVLGASTDDKPPARNIEGYVARARKTVIPETHAYARHGEERSTPEQWVLSGLDEMELAEMIEAHIDFIQGKSSVHLPTPFVNHYVRRQNDDALPMVVAIAQVPIVSADGEIIAPDGLDRRRGIIFEIPKEIRALLPRPEDCTPEAIKDAMRFLCDEWLCDVLIDGTGKAIIIAATLTIIERSLLDNRPTYFITSGRRSSGKGTTIEMIVKAAMGVGTAMQSWSSNVEERRKTLGAIFQSGVGYVAWDNIERGSTISCPHIERACTAKFYSDRRLGVSEMINAAASAIHFFTGNAIRPRGDMASRSLIADLAVDRPDPENRPFKHPDPIGWTEDHRPEILRALYTIMLGNPQLKLARDAPGKTRFKMWYRLVGSAVEHAAKLTGNELDFKELFLSQEENEDEDLVSLAETLEIMLRFWPGKFSAKSVSETAANKDSMTGRSLYGFFYPEPDAVVTPKSMTRRLAVYVNDAVALNKQTALVLRCKAEHNNKVFWIETIGDAIPETPM